MANRNSQIGIRKSAWLVAAALALGAIALYWPATGYDFVNYDDPVYFSENARVLEGLTWSNLVWAFQTTLDASWYPVSWLSFLLDAELYGHGPFGPHLTNVLLHAANGVLLFLFWERLAGSLWCSAFVAGLFILHPLHVESVAWVSQRKDVLSTCFGLLALMAYARYAQGAVASNQWPVVSGQSSVGSGQSSGVPATHHGPRTTVHRPLITDYRLLFYFLSLFFFALGLLSKPMLVTWPFVMLLLDYWPLKRMQNAGPSGTLHAPRSTLDAPRSTVHASRFTLHVSRLPAQSQIADRKSQILFPLFLEKAPFLLLALLVSIVNVVVHRQAGAIVSLTVTPMSARIANAFVSYSRYLERMFWPTDLAIPYLYRVNLPLGSVGLGVVLVAGLSAAAGWLGRGKPYLLVGWFWFLGTLVPVIGLVQWGNQAMADRFFYVPSIGLFVALAWGLGELLGRGPWPKAAVGAAAALVLLALALRSRDQLAHWRDSETLFRHTLAVTGNNYLAHNNLGAALAKQGRTDEAIRQFHAAIGLEPDEANAHYNLANALLKQSRTNAAIGQFQEAVRLNPQSAVTRYNLGIAFGLQGQTDAAITQFQEALRLQPANPEALGALASALAGQGKYADAIRFYQAALNTQPNQEGVLNNLAWLLASCPDAALRNGPEALRLATRAGELTRYRQPRIIGTLAAAQAEAGDFQAATATAERAAALADTLGLTQVAARNRELLQLYRQHQPFHEKGQMTTDGRR